VTFAVLAREAQAVMATVTHSSAARSLGSTSHTGEELAKLINFNDQFTGRDDKL
jgi:hypothetical protein